MKSIIAASANEAWLTMLRAIVNDVHLKPISPRGMVTLETPTSVTVPLTNSVVTVAARKLNYKFAVAEAYWILSGYSLLSDLHDQANKWVPFSDDGIRASGAYGPPFLEQFRYVVDTLKADTYSRQAVMTIWRPNPRPSKDIPCTVALQFVIREQQLNVHVTMRSSDLWLGLPYDFITFTTLAMAVAAELKTLLGTLTVTCPCTHIYDKNTPAVMDVLANWHEEVRVGQGHAFLCYSDLRKHLEALTLGMGFVTDHAFLVKREP